MSVIGLFACSYGWVNEINCNFRVTPAYMVIILFYMTWFPKMGEGPLWDDRLQLEKERCMESWWTNILYINNYVNTDKLVRYATLQDKAEGDS